MKIIVIVMVAVVLATVSARWHGQPVGADAESTIVESASSTAAGDGEAFLLPVVGVVSAVDTVTLVAKQAGTVTLVGVDEGDVVVPEEVVATVVNPVLKAELGAATAAGLMRTLQLASAQVTASTAASTAAVAASSTEAHHRLVTVGEAVAVTDQVAGMSTVFTAVAAALPQVLSFVQENHTLFTPESMDLYREVVPAWYGRQPNYLRASSLLPAASSPHLLAAMEAATTTTDATRVASTATAVEAALLQIATLYADSERQFFDEDELARDDERLSAYRTERDRVTSLLTSVRAARATLTALLTEQASGMTVRQASVDTSRLVASSHDAVARLAAFVVSASTNLAAAEAAVVSAALAEGLVTTPYHGVVETVYVTEGQYVVPGTPLARIVAGAHEVRFSIPQSVVPLVAVGMSLRASGVTVGQVVSVVPVGVAGGASVVVALEPGVGVAGASFSGDLTLSTADATDLITTVSRDQMAFMSLGPVVMTDMDETIAVTILSSAGDRYLVRLASQPSGSIRKQTGVTFSRSRYEK